MRRRVTRSIVSLKVSLEVRLCWGLRVGNNGEEAKVLCAARQHVEDQGVSRYDV